MYSGLLATRFLDLGFIPFYTITKYTIFTGDATYLKNIMYKVYEKLLDINH